MSENPRDSTDFGFQSVPRQDKARRVRGVFDSVADRYDLMNDLMSGGAHRLWKRFALVATGLRAGARARHRRRHRRSGRRDLRARWDAARPRGIRRHQRRHAAARARPADRPGIDLGTLRLRAGQRRAACPFADGSFDCVTIGFGLRNVTDKAAALGVHAAACSARRTTAGARILHPPCVPWLSRLYDAYSFNVLPLTRPLRRRRCRQLPLSRRIDPAAPGSGKRCWR